MAAPRTEPCADWAELADVELCVPGEPGTLDPTTVATMIDVASGLLFELSGHRFSGSCTDTVRPCRRSAYWERPASWLASWGVCACQSSEARACGCPTLSEITLGGYPLTAITSVRVDGSLLTPDAYRIDDYQYLVRIDGEQWPCCQDLAADPATDDNTFEVVYTYGVAPPAAGVHAAAKLASELYQACRGGPCSLPERLQRVARQGVEIGFLDPFEFFREGKTGIYDVDLFLVAVNPHGRRRRATIASPNITRRSRRADT